MVCISSLLDVVKLHKKMANDANAADVSLKFFAFAPCTPDCQSLVD